VTNCGMKSTGPRGADVAALTSPIFPHSYSSERAILRRRNHCFLRLTRSMTFRLRQGSGETAPGLNAKAGLFVSRQR
jgi:hypothetical protein